MRKLRSAASSSVNAALIDATLGFRATSFVAIQQYLGRPDPGVLASRVD
jgi:hypothetical protein